MRNSLARSLTVVTASLVLAGSRAEPAAAQGSGSSRLNQPAPARPAPYPVQPRQGYVLPGPTYAQPRQAQVRAATAEEFYQSLWKYLVRQEARYTRWPSLPGKVGPRAADDPHGPKVRAYANPVAAGDPANLPYGSILVLEDYSEDLKRRSGISVLYRVRGYDPRNGDWYWMKYLEDGTVVRAPAGQGGAPLAGRVTACIDCHRKAAGKDFVFANDAATVTEGAPAREGETR